MSYVKIDKAFYRGVNFWELNPQMTILHPYSKMYDKDKTKDKSESSWKMWFVVFMCDPDEEDNIFYRYSYDERIMKLKQAYFEGIDENDEEILECIASYPNDCLSSIQRSLKEEMDAYRDRAEVLKREEYKLDHYMTNEDGELILDKSGKPIHIKGTATQIDKAMGETANLLLSYEKLWARFVKEKSTSRLTGGRSKTPEEEGKI